MIHELVPHGTGSHTEFLNLFRSQIDNLDAGLDKAFTGFGLVFRVQLRTLIGQRFSGGFPDQPLSLRVQLVPPLLVGHHDLHPVVMDGSDRILQHFVVLGAIQMRERVAFAVNGPLLKRGIGFSPCHRRGVHAEGLRNFNFHGGIRSTYLEPREVFDARNGLLDRYKIPVAILGVHDGLESDIMRHLDKVFSEFSRINGRVQLFLILRARDIREVKNLIQRRKVSHIGGGAHRHLKASFLGAFHENAVAAQHRVGENLNGNPAVTFLFDKFLELFKGQGDMVARRGCVGNAEAEFRPVIRGKGGRGESDPHKAKTCKQLTAKHLFHNYLLV